MHSSKPIGFCPDCGTKLVELDKFCGNCGLSRLEMQDLSGTDAPKPSDLSDDHEIRFGRFDSKEDQSEATNSNLLKENQSLLWIGAGFILLVGIAFLGKSSTNEGTSFLPNPANSIPAVSTHPPSQPVPAPSSTGTPQTPLTSKPVKVVQKTHAQVSTAPLKTEPKPKKVDLCAIDSQTTSDLVSYKNLIASIPVGSNDSSNTSRILDWAQSASTTSDAVNTDSSHVGGRISSLLVNASSDLSILAGLASDWANNNLADPTNFPTQYSAAAGKVRTDYSRMTALCGTKLPGL